ncbi:MAG: hypothetical protein DMG57_39180, partial [Acidobacteria bacterium]
SLLKNPPLFGAVAGGPAVGGLSPETADTRSQQVALNYTRTQPQAILSEVRREQSIRLSVQLHEFEL